MSASYSQDRLSFVDDYLNAIHCDISDSVALPFVSSDFASSASTVNAKLST